VKMRPDFRLLQVVVHMQPRDDIPNVLAPGSKKSNFDILARHRRIPNQE
jgi:hypothetical protein